VINYFFSQASRLARQSYKSFPTAKQLSSKVSVVILDAGYILTRPHWELLYNPNFNRVEFEAVKTQAGLNSFVLTPQKWVALTNANDIVFKAGR
jgi:hypothetical protein